MLLSVIALLAVSQCELNGTIINPFYVYKASDIIDCYNTVPVDQDVITEALKAASEMIEFYHGTDVAMSTDPNIVGKVDLRLALAEFRIRNWDSDFQFHSSMGRLFSKLHDGHTAYIIPSGYHSAYALPIVLGSKLVNNQQVIYVSDFHSTFSTFSPGQSWSSIAVNDTISEINGFPALSYLADFFDENGASKTRGADLNRFLREVRTFSNTVTGLQLLSMDITILGGATHTIPLYAGRADRELTTALIISQNVPQQQTVRKVETQSTLSEIDQLHSISRELRDARVTDFEHRIKPISTPERRNVEALSPSELWTQGNVVAQFPKNTSDPNIVCTSFEHLDDPVMYLYIDTFHPEIGGGSSCGDIRVLADFVKVVEACNDRSSQTTELILDVRGNGGGVILLYWQILNYFSPKLWLPTELREASKTTSSFHVEPAVTASVKGAWEYSLTNMTRKYLDLYYAVVFSDSTYNVILSTTGESLIDEPLSATDRSNSYNKLKDLFTNKLVEKSRATGSPKVWVAPKLERMYKPFVDFKNVDKCRFRDDFFPKQPTKGFATIKVMSLGLCGSSCSHTVKLLNNVNAATVFTAGGVSGERHRISSTTNAPVYQWNAWTDIANSRGMGDGLTPITMTNAALSFSLAAFYPDLTDPYSGEFEPVYAKETLPYWPPFSPATELDMLKQIASKSISTTTGWVEYENGTFKVPGTVVAESVPATPSPPSSGLELGVLLLVIILPTVTVIAVIIIVFCFHKKRSTEQTREISHEMHE